MDDRANQVEALQVAGEYCEKLIPGIQNVIVELKGVRQPDTTEYLETIMKGINWLIQVYNGVRELLKEEAVAVDEDSVNAAIILLNNATKADDDAKRAEALGGGIFDFVKEMKQAAEKITA